MRPQSSQSVAVLLHMLIAVLLLCASAAVRAAGPVCTLSASPASVVSGATSTLTASCSPAASSYVWTGGSCAGTRAATCTDSPTTTTTYTLAGANATGGTGAAASATVTVTSPAPVCTLSASPASVVSGATSTLTASCNPAASSYVWTGGSCAGTRAATCSDSPTTTTTYTLAGANTTGGTGAAATATISVTQSVAVLILAVAKSGNGTLTSTPAAINCGTTCNASFISGTRVTLTATPDAGSTFAGWRGACTGAGACTVTMDAARSVTATFNTIPFGVVTTGVTAGGVISAGVATVTNKITFNSADIGKPGSVFITAVVPSSFLLPLVAAQSVLSGLSATTTVPSSTFILVQLTPTGWQQVTNGQLIPYATGVLGDQLAAQTILNNTDTSGLLGSQFCVGYGTSAAEMNSAERMQLIASIPDAAATGSASLSCLVTVSQLVPKGWSLLGNSQNQSFQASALYSDASWVTSVWKWDSAQKLWQFYAPNLDAAALQSYVSDRSYSVLSEIKPGDGYWVSAKAPASVTLQSGTLFNLTSAHLVPGWNLVSTGTAQTPSAFSSGVGTVLTSLWAWDTAMQAWYFYAPSMEAQGGTVLEDYISSKGYLNFTSANKTLGPGVGFWVNKP